MDHLFDCEFRCEDRYARWISVDLGKTILVAPELAGFSHSQGQSRHFERGAFLALYPNERTCRAAIDPSESCQQRP